VLYGPVRGTSLNKVLIEHLTLWRTPLTPTMAWGQIELLDRVQEAARLGPGGC